jgi:proline iminopeptidase
MFLKVDRIHNINFETYGSSDGIPVLFIHGGPGLGYSESDKRFFDPSKHFILFYDQRGCGRSIPTGSLEQNKTEHLIEDILKLLDHLNIGSAHIFGGSWGATLGVLFSAKYPNRSKSLVLRGFFSATKSTLDLYLQGGIKRNHPLVWERVISLVPE